MYHIIFFKKKKKTLLNYQLRGKIINWFKLQINKDISCAQLTREVESGAEWQKEGRF